MKKRLLSVLTASMMAVTALSPICADASDYEVYADNTSGLEGYSLVSDAPDLTQYGFSSDAVMLENAEGKLRILTHRSSQCFIEYNDADKAEKIIEIVKEQLPDDVIVQWSDSRCNVFFELPSENDIDETAAKKLCDTLVQKELADKFEYTHDKFLVEEFAADDLDKLYEISSDNEGNVCKTRDLSILYYSGNWSVTDILYDRNSSEIPSASYNTEVHRNTEAAAPALIKTTATTAALPSDIQGDANCDGKVNMGDAVLIMQAIANPDKYGLNGTDATHITSQGTLNGDTDGNGITNNDALAIQKKLLGLT